ncbi:MAG: 3-deoxy-manno-octulosonate cytidylyltransferase [Candidatus Omnitrophota bacterium]
MKTKAIGVIPARWASTRFPGKVLADLNGKPMIYYVWRQARKSSLLQDVIIACDAEHVEKACKAFGAKAVMTSSEHQSGTDRIAEAVRNVDADIVVNIQGDEPLISPDVIDRLAAELINADKHCPVATVIKRIDDEADVANPNVVKVVVDCNGYALYFSRHGIPYHRSRKEWGSGTVYFKHLGIYAYRKNFLMGFHSLPVSFLEEAEKLEQLRVLEAGLKIKTITTESETLGVDTPEDLERVARVLKEDQ